MAIKQIFLATALSLFFCLEMVSSASPGSIRKERDVGRDIQKGLKDLENKFEMEKIKIELQELVDSIWGGICINDNACYEEISYCQTEEKLGPLLKHIVGKCFPRGWVFLIMISVALVTILSIVGCCACIRSCLCN